MRDTVLEEGFGSHFEPFLFVKPYRILLGLEIEPLGAHVFDGIRDAFVENPAAKALPADAGDHPADLDGPGFVLLEEKAQVRDDAAVIFAVVIMHGIVVLAVDFGIGAVLLDDEDCLTQTEDLVEFTGGELGKSLYDSLHTVQDKRHEVNHFARNCVYLYIINTHAMTLEQQIQEDIKAAMKAKDTVAMNAVRAVKSEILLFKTAEGGSKNVTDGDILKMVQKLVKQRREAAEQYVAAGRQELADNELAEAAVMEKYLPKQLSPEEVEAKVREIIAQTGAASIKDMGKVMGAANKVLAGQSDGRTISAIVKQLLGGQ